MENRELTNKDLRVLARINTIIARGKYKKAPGVLRKLNRYAIKHNLQNEIIKEKEI